jgi:hypothetical protein
MAKIMTLGDSKGLGAPADGQCKCVYNPRTKKGARLCFVGKGGKTRSGWIFKPGGCAPRR